VIGPEFRRVDMSGTERGGGILANASVLTVSSYSTRTSPVLRGKWILENLLNAPPPAPPPGVPPLDDSKGSQTATLRQQMEEHRKNPACASCHSRMDPLGFGLENFDAIGAWRTQDGKFPVDASGALPDGRSFQARPTEGDSQGGSRRCRARSHREAAHLCTGPRPGAVRQAYGGRDCRQTAFAGLQILATRSWNRKQPSVPDEERS
jgi:hypothetical protein